MPIYPRLFRNSKCISTKSHSTKHKPQLAVLTNRDLVPRGRPPPTELPPPLYLLTFPLRRRRATAWSLPEFQPVFSAPTALKVLNLTAAENQIFSLSIILTSSYMKNIYKTSKLRDHLRFIYNCMNDPVNHKEICFSTKNISYK